MQYCLQSYWLKKGTLNKPVEFVNLTPEQFESFTANHPLASFIQSVARGHRRETDGYKMHLVGVVEYDTVLAVAELDERQIFGKFSDFTCLQGPILNYDNSPLLEFFLNGLQNYVKSHNCVKVTINPPVSLTLRDIHGKIIDTAKRGDHYIKEIESYGFKHLDNIAVDQGKDNYRWFMTKDMSSFTSQSDLMSSFDGKTRNAIRKSEKLAIQVSEIGLDQLDLFTSVMQKSEERNQITRRSDKYYHTMKQCFGDDVKLIIAKLNRKTSAESVKQLIATVKAEVVEYSSTPDQARILRDAQEKLQQYRQLLAKVEQLEEEDVVLATAVFVQYHSELVYLLSGLDLDFAWTNGQYAIQWHMLCQALEQGLQRYNFYGTGGNFSHQPEQHGVYLFKRGFGGMIEEQIGFFEVIINKKIHALRQMKGLAVRLRKVVK